MDFNSTRQSAWLLLALGLYDQNHKISHDQIITTRIFIFNNLTIFDSTPKVSRKTAMSKYLQRYQRKQGWLDTFES